MNTVKINNREIGEGHPPYIIAEMSANHNGRLDTAMETINKAKACGADAIKLQTYTADSMTIDCDKDDFLIHGGLWDGYKLYDLYLEASTPYEWHKPLFEHARKLGITVFSTPFDESAVDFLEDLNTPAYKIASFEATDLPLIKYAASTGKPIIVSTGIANAEEIAEIVETAREAGCESIVLLHCISSYPAPVDQSNLLTIPDLRSRFNTLAGLSDHTLTNTTSIAAVALGAVVIEKHFTLNRNVKGPDSAFSIEPDELKALCRDSYTAWQALGKADYSCKQAERAMKKFRRSVYFVKEMYPGDTINKSHIRRIRPGLGMPPKLFDSLLGKTVNAHVTPGTPASRELINE